jgi:hypothetical protein
LYGAQPAQALRSIHDNNNNTNSQNNSHHRRMGVVCPSHPFCKNRPLSKKPTRRRSNITKSTNGPSPIYLRRKAVMQQVVDDLLQAAIQQERTIGHERAGKIQTIHYSYCYGYWQGELRAKRGI